MVKPRWLSPELQDKMTSKLRIKEIVGLALKEDLGGGDITSEALIPNKARGVASITAKENMVVAGLEVAKEVFSILDAGIHFETDKKDGEEVGKGDVIALVTGDARTLLTGERTALNFLQRLSAVATLTREFVKRVEGAKAVIVDTRKTTPGLRALEKYAVRVGGGRNHRQGLHDMFLIKDNHIALVGGVKEAVEMARQAASMPVKIEVEAETLQQVREALEAEADIIMLDNMTIDEMREAVTVIKGWAQVEASGGIDLERVMAVAETGVDFISVGGITHSAGSVDISMDIVLSAG